MIIDISTKIGTTSNQGGFKGLLDVYSGAAAAYSLRKLSKATTSVVRVRRDSDNAEADFTAQEITDGTLEAWVNTEYTFFSDTFDGTYTWNTVLGSASVTGGVLDFPNTSTTVTFVSLGNTIRTQQVRVTFTILNYVSGTIRFENFNNGASGTLRSGNGTYTEILTISSSGNNNFGFTGDMQGQIDNLVIEQLTSDGLVTTWYDQSGNGNDATQSTAASQPKIVSAGVLVTENGKPAVDFDGVDDFINVSYGITSQPVYSFAVAQINYNSPNASVVLGHSSVIDPFTYGRRRSTSNWILFAGNVLSDVVGDSLQNLHSVYGNSTNSFYYINGVEILNGDAGVGFNITYIGRNQAEYFDGKSQEILVYNSDQSASRTGIENKINQYYDIYP